MLNIVALLMTVSLLASAGAESVEFPTRDDWRTQFLPADAAQSPEALEAALAPWQEFVDKYSAWSYERLDWPEHVERWRELVEQHFRPEDVELALAVIACESSGNPKAFNSKFGATGLWQHLSGYWERRAKKAGVPRRRSPRNPEAATIVAAWLVYHTSSSWKHWSCITSPRLRVPPPDPA